MPGWTLLACCGGCVWTRLKKVRTHQRHAVSCHGRCVPVLRPSLVKFSLLPVDRAGSSDTHLDIFISSVRGLGAGLVPAWADPDYGWESNVSGEAAF